MIGPVSLLLLLLQAVTAALELPPCDSSKLNSCGNKNLMCQDVIGKCKCLEGFYFNANSESLDDACVETLPSGSDSSGRSSATTVVVIFIFLTLIIGGLVVAVRRYNLVHWFRQNVISRRDNNVMYEDVMIGQDDPPITA